MTLLEEIEAFMAKHKMAATTFGLKAVNKGHLVSNLRKGKDTLGRTQARVRAFMREYEG